MLPARDSLQTPGRALPRATLLVLLLAALTLALPAVLSAGSRLGKVTGVIDQVIAIDLGQVHGVRQGMRGTVFRFDQERRTIQVATIQVIGVQEQSSLARITALSDSLAVGQLVDIEGAQGPRTLEKVNVLAEMEEAARNYFAAYHYTEPDSANCLAECRRIMARDPENRLAAELIRQMLANYYDWAERERLEGRFAHALVYYSRILRLDQGQERAYDNLFDVLDLVDAESRIPLEAIPRGRPPDFYYAVAEQYHRHGQFDKSSRYFQFLLDYEVPEDPVAREGIARNGRMLELIAELRTRQSARTEAAAREEQRRRQEDEERRARLERARYFKTVADDLFRKEDFTGALIYYLRLLEVIPDDSLALARREAIAKAGMVLIPTGEYSRGSSTRELSEVMVTFGVDNALYRELPKNWVYLDSFYIDRTEVTNRQYRHFVESTGHSPPLHWVNGRYPEGEDYFPVVYVSWLDACAFARWIGRRLPTEEEWEKAARGPDGFQWPWGDQFYAHRGNMRESGKGGPLPVGSFLSGANEYGLLDLAGNVWEWVDAELRPYPGYVGERYYFPEGIRKVMRGGAFNESGEKARAPSAAPERWTRSTAMSASAAPGM